MPSTTTPSKPYAGGAVGEVLDRVLEVRRRRVGPLVVVADEDDRQAGARRRSSSPRARRRAPRRPRRTSRPRRARSSRIRNASAQPTATGSIAGRWLTIAIRPRRASAMWTLPSRPLVGPSARPMYCAKIRHGSTPRVMWTPMSRCSGVPTSSGAHRGRDRRPPRPRCRGPCRTSPGSCPACRGCGRAPRCPRVISMLR